MSTQYRLLYIASDDTVQIDYSPFHKIRKGSDCIEWYNLSINQWETYCTQYTLRDRLYDQITGRNMSILKEYTTLDEFEEAVAKYRVMVELIK